MGVVGRRHGTVAALWAHVTAHGAGEHCLRGREREGEEWRDQPGRRDAQVRALPRRAHGRLVEGGDLACTHAHARARTRTHTPTQTRAHRRTHTHARTHPHLRASDLQRVYTPGVILYWHKDKPEMHFKSSSFGSFHSATLPPQSIILIALSANRYLNTYT